MKQLFPIIFLFFCTTTFAQNVGIGETTPTAMKLQVKTADSAVVLLQNSTTSGTNLKTGLFFKTGNSFSGSIATIGASSTHRMGLFTFGGLQPNALQERITILDNGKVGINNIEPEARLQVNSLDSNIATFQNNLPLAAGVKSNIYFKTGNGTTDFYTGAINTKGTANNAASMSFSTFSSTDPTDLKERMTITDDGKIGIGTTTPSSSLDIVGNLRTSTGASIGGLLSSIGLNVFGPVSINGSITASGNGTVNNLTVVGPAQVGGVLSTNSNLQVNGNVRIAGGSPTAGEVLTATDNLGNAVWRTQAFGNNERFFFNTFNSFGTPSYNLVYNLGTASFNTSNGEVTIGKTGLYHFEAKFTAQGPIDYIQGGTTPRTAILSLFRNGGNYIKLGIIKPFYSSRVFNLGGTFTSLGVAEFSNSVDIFLTVGDVIKVVGNVNDGNALFSGDFTGYLIAE